MARRQKARAAAEAAYETRENTRMVENKEGKGEDDKDVTARLKVGRKSARRGV